MKIVRHIAPDMRQALRAIREKLGEDAVILSSRRIPEGVEVTAAVDFDASALQDAMNTPAGSLTAAPLPSPSAATSRALAAPTAPQQVASQHAAPHAAVAPAPSYAQLANDPAVAYSHAAAAHYFAGADVRPFAHILGPEPAAAPAQTQVAAATRGQPTPLTARAQAPAAQAPPARAPVAAAPKAPASEATPVRREPTLNVVVQDDLAAETLAQLPAAPVPNGDTTGSELKTLRRMLETQLAQLAWNDLTRRAPVHVEILRELTEIGISQELSDYILKQLPDKVELGFARRFAIAGLSQYLLVTGDRWLENGGRVAFIGATGVGKTTTLAKLAVRWVLRHGPRDLALVGSDTVRIGAQDQIQSLGQLLGVPVYTPDSFESLPTLLSRLGDRHRPGAARLILIDTPGSSLRDAQLAQRLGVLSNCASQMESALVLGASTQAGAIEETLKRFAPANPACCVLTKLDESTSIGGALSALIKARLPVSYLSEGQRVPEDLRPARALELVSTAVRLAKASGAAADEDLLRRRFGKTAHAIS
jgi:flagellar biosynthesis protein FlhF